MFGIGATELIIILIILLLLFGASKLPRLAKSLGESARELRSGLAGEGNEKSNTKKTNASSEDTDKKA